jgi:hypothetical protein
MALALLTLDHDSPSAPALTRGAALSASGVSAPALQVIGTMTAVSASNGSFNDPNGYGQIDYDSAGALYVADANNTRWQKFTRVSGVWTYHSSVTTTLALGGSAQAALVAIDRSRNEIHLGAWNQTVVDGTWIGVWDLTLGLANLTVANRTRSYGINSGSNGSGNAREGRTLSLDGDYAIVSSSTGDFRVLRWNHLTGAVSVEQTQAGRYVKWVTDGSKWFSGCPTSGVSPGEPGLWEMDESTLDGVTRMDDSGQSTRQNHRINRLRSSIDYTDLAVHGGRVYVREGRFGRLLAWNSTTLAWVDEFAWPGGAGTAAGYGHWPGYLNGFEDAGRAKIGLWVAPTTADSDELVAWSSNADSDVDQSFLTTYPLSTATAVWTYADWAAGSASVLKGFLVAGSNVSAEKVRVEYRRTPDGGVAGSWLEVPWADLGSAAALVTLGSNEYSEGDTLEVRLSLSIWDRQDGHATLVACRDKLPPEDVYLQVVYEDPNADVYVPTATASFTARQGGTAAYTAQQGG